MRPALLRAALLLATLPTLALTGCAALLNSFLGSSGTPANVTGNWSFAIDPGTSAAQTLPALIGALAGQGSNVTGTLHGANCIAATQDIDFTGSQTNSGTLTLTSTNLPSNLATLTVTTSTLAGITTASGTLAITGNGPCAMASTSVIGGLFQHYTGTYTGTLTSATNVPATVTATLTQADANADGEFPETGTVNLSTTTCTDTFSVAGYILGPTLTTTLANQANTPAATGFALGILTPTASTLDLTQGLTVVSPTCNPGTFSGTLNKK
jgi:hypothetical protein